MPLLHWTIDEKTGEMSVDIDGEVGPACENIEKIIAAVAGKPGSVEKKPSYYRPVNNRSRVGS